MAHAHSNDWMRSTGDDDGDDDGGDSGGGGDDDDDEEEEEGRVKPVMTSNRLELASVNRRDDTMFSAVKMLLSLLGHGTESIIAETRANDGDDDDDDRVVVVEVSFLSGEGSDTGTGTATATPAGASGAVSEKRARRSSAGYVAHSAALPSLP